MFKILMKSCLLTGLMTAAATAQALPSIALGATAGTLGVGGQATIGLLPILNARASVQGLGFSPNFNKDGVDYHANLKLLTYGAYLDVYPFTRVLRLSAGLVGNGNRLGLNAGCSTSCNVGSATVSNNAPGNNGSVTGKLDFRSVAPYFGFGFTNPIAGLPFYFGSDFGVLLQGRPRVKLGASGTSTVDFNDGNGPQQVDLAGAQFQTQLASEQTDLSNTTSKSYYKFYPVVQVNIGWRF